MPILTRTYVIVREFFAHLSKGQTLTEYELILGAVAVAVFVAYQVMGQDIARRSSRYPRRLVLVLLFPGPR